MLTSFVDKLKEMFADMRDINLDEDKSLPIQWNELKRKCFRQSSSELEKQDEQEWCLLSENDG